MKLSQALLAILLLAGIAGCKKQTTTTGFNYTGTQHVGYLITFHSNKSEGTYLWDFGDGSRSTDAEPNHTYNNAATFTVTLTADNDSSKKIIKTITIDPAFDFTVSGTTAAGYTLHFTSNAPSTSAFLWNFGDGNTSTDATPSHIFSANNSYDVTLVLNNDPEHTIKKTIQVFANAIYMKNITGSKTFHHSYTNAYPWAPYHTTFPYADTSIAPLLIEGTNNLVIIGSDTLTYQNSSSSDSILVFGYYDFFSNRNDILHFNRNTSALDYDKYIHISAGAGDAEERYYTP